MTLSMTRPWKHPDSGYYWFQKRVPDDLREAMGKREERFSGSARRRRPRSRTMQQREGSGASCSLSWRPSKQPLKNMGASVRARLMAISKERNQTFQLVLTNYHVWVDRCRLRGGDDFWDEINRVLRTVAVKQIVLFSHNTGKPGVKKELAIGEVMRRNLPTRNS